MQGGVEVLIQIQLVSYARPPPPLSLFLSFSSLASHLRPLSTAASHPFRRLATENLARG